MAPESPIRLLEGNDKLSPCRQSISYGSSSSAELAIEDFDLSLNSQRFQSLEKDMISISSQSGSAPPSMEVSIEAIGLLYPNSSTGDCEIVPQPSSFSHHGSIVNLDERVNEPSNSWENSHLFHCSGSTGNDWKITPHAESADGSVQVNRNILPSHEEHPEGDRSSEWNASASVDKAATFGGHSGSSDSTQEDFLAMSSPSHSWSHESVEEKVVSDFDSHALVNLSVSTSSVGTNNPTPGLDDMSQVLPYDHCAASVQSLSLDDGVKATTALNSEHRKFHKKEQLNPPKNTLKQHTALPEGNISPVQGSYPQVVYPGKSHAYGSLNQFHYGSSSVSKADVQPILQTSGFMPPFYAPSTSFMTPQNPCYSNLLPVGFVTQQYGMAGYPFNPAVLPSYLAGYPFNPAVLSDFVERNSTSLSHSFNGNNGKMHELQNQSWIGIDSCSFLEELKSGRGQRFELSDIVGYIGELSIDQHGSRFIQQKLENCSVEEKAYVFKEVVHASKLMTDVFGNYVIQKLFEYGSPDQKKDLANQLESKILELSLHMYGCRVIQKAFEVIDLEQKVQLARELDGHVLRYVRDQNGNHVIQKCIECIPADNLEFIISSFRGQVAALSMHPYGCRVIQRVLKKCDDGLQTQFVVNEILDSVHSLCQDQYGNYVTQHVVKWGIPREKTEIIKKLSGSIVQLSQHKFASNVVEKCLEYGDATARDMLISEIIGNTEKNDNILIMMKDQYANYVVQKILLKCTCEQRELLLGVIRNHRTALKKYTYGKHIVARFEQLHEEDIQTSGS